MIVADANLVTYLAFDGPDLAAAQRVRKRDHDWIAPDLIRYEVGSVIVGKMRRGEITRDQAIRTYGNCMALVNLRNAEPISRLFVEAERFVCSAYDLAYVALAIELRLPLVTADREVLAAYPDSAVSIEHFAEDR